MSKLSDLNKAKTHCPHGHPFDEKNTQILKKGYRRCKTCRRISSKRTRIPKIRKSPLERFLEKIEKTDSCWNWKGGSAGGKYADYGVFWTNIKQDYAHRFSYEIHKGNIEKGFQVDHLCKNRKCVNPDHLEAVSQKENILRGNGLTSQNYKKTHCKRGHEFTPENTKIIQNSRRCITCYNAYMRNFSKSQRRPKRNANDADS